MQVFNQGRAPRSDSFFAALPRLRSSRDTFDLSLYRSAPDCWYLAITDVQGSTAAIEQGRHRTVNYIAAAGIAALRNLCHDCEIPILFAGDGCAVMVPANYGDASRLALARLRQLAREEFNLNLRVGLARVSELREWGADVLVGRYEPTIGNAFGVFAGGGVAALEAALKKEAPSPLKAKAHIPSSLEDGALPDLTGLSCQWQELKSLNGRMLTLILEGRDMSLAYSAVQRLAGSKGLTAATPANLRPRWPAAGVWLEARATHGRKPASLIAARLFVRAMAAYIVLRTGWRVKGFDRRRYIAEIASNTDFCKFDQQLSLVIDCDSAAEVAILAELVSIAKGGDLHFGFHLSPTALMTCFVTSVEDSNHVHFIDGGDGGYTRAAGLMRQDPNVESPTALPTGGSNSTS
ncbi:hypothetical protein GCM10007036_10430 [Alsobacter metallidurans]|uniref:DUF3095 domain-containing protein n=1 Tax=Alsobacter metallidurans TaxID=340221 RepID=A0A917I459_9HYPH|nr:DUF3095 family protein [Alsobacter metallidurans]GGH12530.1 hypothetical protein GCM10007036_10430 [Alsobacter metallidurans]